MYTSIMAQPEGLGIIINSEFQRSALVAIVSATLAFLGSYLLARRKERLAPRKRLSCQLDLEPGLLGVNEDLRSKMSLAYNGEEVSDLYSVSYKVVNIGNRVVKWNR